MKSRNLRSAPAEHLADLAYLIVHLKADPLAASILPDVEAELTALKTRMEDWDTKLQMARETQSGLVNTDESLCNAVRNARNAILDDLRHNRQAPKFLTYFPRGLVDFTGASYPDLVTAVRSLIQRCGQDPSPRIQEQGTLLQAAVDQMERAIARRSAARADEGAAYGELQVQKLQAIQGCRRAAFRLAELYPKEDERVRSYFRKSYRRPRPTAPAEGDSNPATGTTGDAQPTPATPATGARAEVEPTAAISAAAAPKAAGSESTLVLVPAAANR